MPELQMDDRRIFCRLKNEYKEDWYTEVGWTSVSREWWPLQLFRNWQLSNQLGTLVRNVRILLSYLLTSFLISKGEDIETKLYLLVNYMVSKKRTNG
jgi:hypothetical protein